MMKSSKTLYNSIDIHSLTDSESSLLKKLIADILFDIHDICEKNNIEYILAYGTLLGAIRHNGFIPWDDDIDIHIFRKDLNKFFKLFNEKYSDKYKIVELKRHPINIYKIELKGTKLYDLENDTDELMTGLFVDIFPIDYASSNKIVSKLQKLIMLAVSRISSLRENFLFPSRTLKNCKNKEIKRYYTFRRIIGFFCLLFPKEFCNKIFKLFCINHKKNKNICFGLYRTELPESIITDRILHDFEGKLVYVPKDYKLYLTRLFGNDYLQLPPIEQRETHCCVNVDFGKYK